MKEIRLLAPTGNLGSGYLVTSLKRGLAAHPHIIACDAGSTDGGPSYLGSGKPYFPRTLYLRDLSHIIAAGRAERIPVIIGSAGGSGCDAGVDFLAEVTREIAAQQPQHIAQGRRVGPFERLRPRAADQCTRTQH